MKKRAVHLNERYAALFARRRAAGGEPAWLAARRDDAWARLQHEGLPTRAVEEWKYTNLAPLAERVLASPGDPQPARLNPAAIPFWHAEDLHLVFVDGRYSAEWSDASATGELEIVVANQLPADPEVKSADGLTATLLNSAFRSDSVLVRIPAKCRLSRRLHVLLLHATDMPDSLAAPWVALEAGALAEADVAITSFSVSPAASVQIPRTWVSVQPGSHLVLSQTQALNSQSWQLATTRIVQTRDSRVTHLDAALGAALARHDLTAILLESGSEVELNGLYALDQKRHADFHTLIEHRQPECRSRQVYKGILDGRATGVFNGAVRVHPGASGTDGYQLNKTLLLSKEAQMFSKPELLIDNDDVKCSHGATIGQLNEQELFYLQSRGIAEARARQILARGFVEDILFQQSDVRQQADIDRLLDHFFAGSHA